MAEILYVVRREQEDIADAMTPLEEIGFQVTGCMLGEQKEEYLQLQQLLQEKFFYCVVEESFHEETARVCHATGTKYLSWVENVEMAFQSTLSIGKGINYVFVSNYELYCGLKQYGLQDFYYLSDKNMVQMLTYAFQEEEWEIYESIQELADLKNKRKENKIKALEELVNISESEELCLETDKFFAQMELEKNPSLRLKEEMTAYINKLLKKESQDAWQELLVWNKRSEVRELKSYFWEFFVLWRMLLVYMREVEKYQLTGCPVTVINLQSMEEMTYRYLKSIFLIRRLDYGITADAEGELMDYIAENKLSRIYLENIIEKTQVENKDKIRQWMKIRFAL